MEQMETEDIRSALQDMNEDPSLLTGSVYSANTADWSSNRMPFIDAHLMYLQKHPKVNARHYLSNLRLRIKKR